MVLLSRLAGLAGGFSLLHQYEPCHVRRRHMLWFAGRSCHLRHWGQPHLISVFRCHHACPWPSVRISGSQPAAVGICFQLWGMALKAGLTLTSKKPLAENMAHHAPSVAPAVQGQELGACFHCHTCPNSIVSLRVLLCLPRCHVRPRTSVGC